MRGLPSKDARERHELLLRLGYEYQRETSHGLRYTHPSQRGISIPKTPSDRRTADNWLAEVKRRHPEAFVRPKSSQPRKRKRRIGAKPKSFMRLPSAPVAAKSVRFERPTCLSCGYEWISDWPWADHPCPRCAGQMRNAGTYQERAA